MIGPRVNRFEPGPKPLEFTPIVWIALALVGLVGLRQFFAVPENPNATLSYLEGDSPPIIRTSGSHHRFPILGLEIDVTNGWDYLSVADDRHAVAPTFTHKRSQAIVRLEPFRLRDWPPGEIEIEVEQYGDYEVEWAQVDHRRVGRLREPPVDLAIFVVSQRPQGELSPPIRELLGRIRLLR